MCIINKSNFSFSMGLEFSTDMDVHMNRNGRPYEQTWTSIWTDLGTDMDSKAMDIMDTYRSEWILLFCTPFALSL